MTLFHSQSINTGNSRGRSHAAENSLRSHAKCGAAPLLWVQAASHGVRWSRDCVYD